ncbi:hypothetical protein RDABS01_015900 [Bienertia sinuspersici]
MILAEKITAKIRTWGSRSMSYVARCQLVNSVLLTLHTYWASIFMIPKKVLEAISGLCRNFLWSGKITNSNNRLVAWDLVCRPRQNGGLGVKDC